MDDVELDGVADWVRARMHPLAWFARQAELVAVPSNTSDERHNWDMVEISDDDFERMVSEVFDALPDEMVRGVENVAIVVENQPLGERPRLFGLYRGHPLTTRGVYGFGELPDRITLYKNNPQEYSVDLEALRSRVRITLVHEIGHYFGLDDARLRELGWA
ncbi:metallopeptidase family protein [Agromyces humatus]|uniref:Metallopeptidase family protein n=1 Tax=Agromyces humatus TaxID=279573 RepID=A0ABP4WDN6_9MICO|nr:metallopeptidase family protein [Agromyces humatus]